jgi:hypothetical protein
LCIPEQFCFEWYAGTQFFISLGDCSELDGKHVVFGKVVEGMLTISGKSQQGRLFEPFPHFTRPEIVVICWLFHKLKLKVLVEPEAHPCEQTESCFTLCKNHCSGFSLWQELSTQTFAIFCA